MDVDKVMRRIRENAGRDLYRKALKVQAQHVKNLSVSNPAPHHNPAPRGEYPRGRTWNLKDAVVVSPASMNEVIQMQAVTVGVRANAFYGRVLAHRGWKGLIDTRREMGPL